MKKNSFVVIGLGTFGSTVASELAAFGNHVIGIDSEEGPRRPNPEGARKTRAKYAESRAQPIRRRALVSREAPRVPVRVDLRNPDGAVPPGVRNDFRT